MRPGSTFLVLAIPSLVSASVSPDGEVLLRRTSHIKKRALDQGLEAAGKNRMVKRHENQRRWVWGASIIQDDTPSSEVPAVGVNVNLLSDAFVANTPGTPSAFGPPTFPPVSAEAAGTSTTSSPVIGDAAVLVAAPTASASPSAEEVLVGNWVWGSSIIQDGDTDISEAAVQSASVIFVENTTPGVSITPPSFAPLAATTSSSSITTPPAASSSSPFSSTAASTSSTDTDTVTDGTTVLTAEVIAALSEQGRLAVQMLQKDASLKARSIQRP